MKFYINQGELIKALNIVGIAVQSKTVIESLKGIKITATKDQIIFTGSKSELAVEYTIDNSKVQETGDVVVYGHQFLNIIKKLGDFETEILISNEDSLLLIKTDTSKIKLNTLSISEYPDANFKNDQELFEIDKKLLFSAYQKAKYSASATAIKPILTGINLNFSDSELIVSSTDSKRLSYITMLNEKNLNLNYTINRFIFADLIKIVEQVDQPSVFISDSPHQLYLETNNLKIKTRLIDGEYPEVKNLIPSTHTFTFNVSSEKLLLSLEKVMSISDKSNRVVTIEFNDQLLEIKFFVQELGGIEEKVKIENLTGNPFKIAFDPIYMMDAIHSIGATDILVILESETSAFVVQSKDNKDNIQVISPVRMN